MIGAQKLAASRNIDNGEPVAGPSRKDDDLGGRRAGSSHHGRASGRMVENRSPGPQERTSPPRPCLRHPCGRRHKAAGAARREALLAGTRLAAIAGRQAPSRWRDDQSPSWLLNPTVIPSTAGISSCALSRATASASSTRIELLAAALMSVMADAEFLRQFASAKLMPRSRSPQGRRALLALHDDLGSPRGRVSRLSSKARFERSAAPASRRAAVAPIHRISCPSIARNFESRMIGEADARKVGGDARGRFLGRLRIGDAGSITFHWSSRGAHHERSSRCSRRSPGRQRSAAGACARRSASRFAASSLKSRRSSAGSP